MTPSDIKGPGYRVWFDPNTITVYFEGVLRLGTAEYEPVEQLLHGVLATKPQTLRLHMNNLTFLNSSGINTLYKFVIAIRKLGNLAVIVSASSSIAWQSKSLPNLRKFLPSVSLVMDDT